MSKGEYFMVQKGKREEWVDVLAEGIEGYRRNSGGKDPKVVIVSVLDREAIPEIDGLAIEVGTVAKGCALVGRR